MERVTGLRKVLSGLIILAVGVAITYVKGDVPAGLGSLLQNLFIAFVIGNGVEHATVAFKTAKQSQVFIPDLDLSSIENALQEQKATLEALSKAPQGTQNLEEVKTTLNGVINQNAVIAQNLGVATEGIRYLVSVVQGSQKQP